MIVVGSRGRNVVARFQVITIVFIYTESESTGFFLEVFPITSSSTLAHPCWYIDLLRNQMSAKLRTRSLLSWIKFTSNIFNFIRPKSILFDLSISAFQINSDSSFSNFIHHFFGWWWRRKMKRINCYRRRERGNWWWGRRKEKEAIVV